MPDPENATVADSDIGEGGSMKRLLTAVACAASLLATGCVSVGTAFDPAQIALLQPGDSQASVITRLGPPNSTSRSGDGNTVMVWLHSTGNALGQGRSRSVALLFGPDGKLLRVLSESSSQIDIR